MILFYIIFGLLAVLTNSCIFFNIILDKMLLQTLLVYFIYRLSSSLNLYQLVGYSALTLISISSLLFWLQFDVFACFLLVAESIVLLFTVSILMHLNYTNTSKFQNQKPLLILLTLVCFLPTITLTENYSYWVDWSWTQSSQFNDLLPQYLYFYVLDSPIVVLTGLWLLFLTFLIVQLILAINIQKTTFEKHVSYLRKTQNIWTQWYKKPILRFFKK